MLGLSTVNIGATAVAQVQNFDEAPCILALTGSISFQGSPTVTSPNCGIASNSTASNAFDFTGNGGLNINAPSFSAGGCSQTGGNQCDKRKPPCATSTQSTERAGFSDVIADNRPTSRGAEDATVLRRIESVCRDDTCYNDTVTRALKWHLKWHLLL